MRTVERDIVGAFIFSSDSCILLGKNGKGGAYGDRWIVPGGGIEEGETKLQAVIREVQEEVGIDISDADITQREEVLSGESQKTLRDTGETVVMRMTFYDFMIHIAAPAAAIPFRTEDDLVEAQWFPLSELATLAVSPPMEHVFKQLGYR